MEKGLKVMPRSKVRIPFSPPEITNEDRMAVMRVLESGWITTGAVAKQFEHELASYVGVQRVAVLNSATAALEIALRLLNIGEGDEVITTPYTYAASANVILHVGARPVFVDIKSDGFNIDPDAVSKAITSRTKAILCVDIAGYPCDYNELKQVMEAKRGFFSAQSDQPWLNDLGRIALIADAAHSFGATYHGQHSGALADLTAFSFHAVKNLTTGEGGALCFNNIGSQSSGQVYEQIMLWSLHGQNRDALSKSQLGQWRYDIMFAGYKCNMPDMVAALGLSQLQRYKTSLAKRREHYQYYQRVLQPLKGRVELPLWDDLACTSAYHLALVTFIDYTEKKRDHLIEQLAISGVSTNVHFQPLPLLTAYKERGYQIADYPLAYKRYSQVISLPLYVTLTREEIDFVAEQLIENI
jgi:dTDP-4-amino-4,6-dideoxygalactose transaminase